MFSNHFERLVRDNLMSKAVSRCAWRQWKTGDIAVVMPSADDAVIVRETILCFVGRKGG
jgi:hypothetical protein